jgi:hypothetical protein
MNVGIVVEGASDESTYRKLLPRIRNDIGALQIRECLGKSGLKNRFVGFLKEFQRNPAWQIDAAFVICDSDCNPSKPIEDQLRGILVTSAFIPKFRVEFLAIGCMVESLLLSDLEAIRKAAVRRGQIARAAAASDIQIGDANSSANKDIFFQVLRDFGLPAIPAVYGEIAATANLDLVASRCNYFPDFVRRIRGV